MPIPAGRAESRRTAALALWRYAHDYLKAAQALCESDRVACNESQALYHLAAQGVEFALKAFLRTRGVPFSDLNARIGHSMLDALEEALARGMPTPPFELLRAIRKFAPYLRDDQFHYLPADFAEFPDLGPLLEAGMWILAQMAEDAVADYYVYHGRGSDIERVAMLRRMRADVDVTMSKISRMP